MNKPIKNIIYLIILIISIVLVLIYSTNILGGGIQIIKHTSSLEAEIAINNKYLNHNSIENDTLINANSYTIVKVPIKKLSSSILPLTVKPEHQFHVFQNNHLIYSQLENNYYQGFSSQRKTYSLLASDYLKVLHHIPLHSHDPIYLLIKKQIDQNINSIVSLPDVKQKNLQSLKETQIPIIKINTHNQYLATEKYQFTTSEIIFKEASYTTLSKIRIRGTSSVHFPKKQLNIIFEEESILNEVKLKKNVLVSAFNDKSLMRNKIADNLFSVFNQSSSYVHLIINDFYEGLYLLREHPEIQFQKLINDTEKLNFLLKIDRGPYDFYAESKNGYLCEYPNRVTDEIITITRGFENDIKLGGIRPNDSPDHQIHYLKNRFGLTKKTANSIINKASQIINQSNSDWQESIEEKAQKQGHTFYHQVLKDAHWILHRSISGYKELHFSRIDTTSFIDFIILNELSKNIDAYRLSSYLSYVNNQFTISVIWDFDLSWGLANYNDGFNHENFIIESDIKEYIPVFWQDLWNNELFQNKLKKRYQKLRLEALSEEAIENNINDIYKHIHPSAKENFERWEIIGKDIWPNKFNFKTYEEEIEYLKTWSSKRLKWLDSKWHVNN